MMSLLWSNAVKKKQSTRNKKPSPTCRKKFPDSARNSESSLKDCRKQSFVSSLSIKGISLFTSLFETTTAGMTVEASIVLPLFLFFFLNLGCAIEMIRLHGNLQLALWQIGSKLSVYGYVADSGEQSQDDRQDNAWWKELTGIAVSSTYIKKQIIDSAGKQYLDQSPLTNGGEGLQFWESRLFGSKDEISIVVTYSVSPWISLMGFGSFRMSNRYYSHIWNGYQLSGSDAGSESKRAVYVARTGRVYHIRSTCSYLMLSVKMVPASEIDKIRNQSGGKYDSCLKCTRGTQPAMYYITLEGNRYHFDKDCSGLKRTIHTMTLDQAVESGYAPCSRCGKHQ